MTITQQMPCTTLEEKSFMTQFDVATHLVTSCRISYRRSGCRRAAFFRRTCNMADNKIAWNINSILDSLSKDERKNVKTNPVELAKKWGNAQVDFLKKIKELQKVDAQMH